MVGNGSRGPEKRDGAQAGQNRSGLKPDNKTGGFGQGAHAQKKRRPQHQKNRDTQ